MRIIALALAAVAFTSMQVAPADQDVERTITSGGIARMYRVFVPESVVKGTRAPAVVLFNGSGSPVQSLMEFWKTVARRDGIVLIGPGAFASGSWRIPEDSPEFSHDAVEAVKREWPIDGRRVYLYGHSGGGGHVLALGLLESEYYAAVGAHANALPQGAYPMLDLAKRKIPFGLWIGTSDQLVPLSVVHETNDVLISRGFPVEMHEIKDHTHSYAERGDELTNAAWNFLKIYKLDADPVYHAYQIRR